MSFAPTSLDVVHWSGQYHREDEVMAEDLWSIMGQKIIGDGMSVLIQVASEIGSVLVKVSRAWYHLLRDSR